MVTVDGSGHIGIQRHEGEMMAENAAHELKTCPYCGGDDIVEDTDSNGQVWRICLSCVEMWLKVGSSS